MLSLGSSTMIGISTVDDKPADKEGSSTHEEKLSKNVVSYDIAQI